MWSASTNEPTFSAKGPDYQYLYSVLARRVSVAHVLSRRGLDAEACAELDQAIAIIEAHEAAMNTTSGVAHREGSKQPQNDM